MKDLDVTDYMPELLKRLQKIIKGMMIIVSVIIVIFFYLRVGNLKMQKEEYDDYVKLIEEYKYLMEMGEQYYNTAEYNKSMQYYTKAIDIIPENENAYIMLSTILQDKHEYSQAIEILKKIPKSEGGVELEIERLKQLIQDLEKSQFIQKF
ncbi:hypothetical protein LJC58_05865 [Lachnospiraceae bacterium OttesenSCG-928-D06]|nr:hypothetical protein [Lachnospiraceae bacterium OttesenSCG-928-D06]